MKKPLWACVLFGCSLVIQAVNAETDHQQSLRDDAVQHRKHKLPSLKVQSHIALIYDEQTQTPLYEKHAEMVAPIASITKLMTAMVTLEAHLPMDEQVSITDDELKKIRPAKSKLRTGMTLTRSELLRLALMASENRAALALARSYPGGTSAMVAAMNLKADILGMHDTRFLDPTGLDSDNVSTAQDLVKMVSAAHRYPLIQKYTTSTSYSVEGLKGRTMRFSNTNPLVRNTSWEIGLSKTGYISEAGLCLVMEANIEQRPVIIVLLNSWGKRTRVGDANRVRRWMEKVSSRNIL